MNKHTFLDTLTATIASIIGGKKKFFARNAESRSFAALIGATEVSLPDINGEGVYDAPAGSPAGPLDPAFKVEKWLGPGAPTVIYHHGNNERPFNYQKGAKNTFLNIFVQARDEFDANLIVVRAPFHHTSLRTYQEKMTDLENFMAMIATSVKVNEALIARLRASADTPILTTGISLGGWVTNLHRGFFNTSTLYAPIMAGTYLAELFLQSKYKKMTGKAALNQPASLRTHLNFNALFEQVTTENVFPLLARHDQFIEFEVQSNSYGGHPVQTMEAGHITGALNAPAIREHLLRVLQKMNSR